jgi:hypothetical protein
MSETDINVPSRDLQTLLELVQTAGGRVQTIEVERRVGDRVVVCRATIATPGGLQQPIT